MESGVINIQTNLNSKDLLKLSYNILEFILIAPVKYI